MLRIVVIIAVVVLYNSTATAQIIVNLIDNFTLEPLKEHTVSCKSETIQIKRLSASGFVIDKPKEGVVLTITSPGYIIQVLTLSEAKKEVIDLVIQPGDSLLTAYRSRYDFYGFKAADNNVNTQREATTPAQTNSPESINQHSATSRPEKNVFSDSLADKAPESEDKIVGYPGTAPEFSGGTTELKKFLGINIRYPQRAIELDIQGTVYVQFVVSKTGEVSNIRVVRGINLPMDSESVRVVKKMPDWIPGTVDGKPVNTYFNLPIKFKLQ